MKVRQRTYVVVRFAHHLGFLKSKLSTRRWRVIDVNTNHYAYLIDLIVTYVKRDVHITLLQ